MIAAGGFDKATALRDLTDQPHLEAFLFAPTGRTHYRCTGCGANVNPKTHRPGSEACDRVRDERNHSRADD